MNLNEIKKYFPWVAVGVPAVLAIVVFIFGVINPNVATKVLLIIAAVLLLALAAVLYMILFTLAQKKSNFFLTDLETGKTVGVDKLNFAMVNSGMNVFLAERIDGEADVITGEILTKHGIFGQNDIYRPLVAYKILFDLSEENTPKAWSSFYAMSENAFSELIEALNTAGDNNMARRLMQLRQMRDDARLADFIVGNQRYLQRRMLIFVKSNIEMFDDVD